MNYNYKTRKSDEFKLITSTEEKTNSTTELLKKEYPYILHSMKNENYKIDYDEFDILQEIIDDEKVIGIMSLIKIESFDNSLCINEVYILPEYRKKGLFYQTLLNLLSQPNMTLSLRNPNKRMIDLLIEYDFAQRLENNLVISYINFQVDYSKRYINRNTRKYYESFKKDNQLELIRTNFYDLNINSSIFFDLENIILFDDNPLFIEKARQTDSKEDNYYSKLANLDLTYLEVLLKRLLNVEKYLELLYYKVDYRINENLNTDDILGTKSQLTPIFIDILKENNLNIEDGLKIRMEVVKALKNNEIIPKSIILRTMYLIENYYQDRPRIDKKTELGDDFEEECPYCSTLNNNILEVCSQCGYNIQRNNHFEEKLPEIIGKKMFSKSLTSEETLRKDIDYGENKLNEKIKNELKYMDIDEDYAYQTQRNIAVYQLLRNIEEPVYFDVPDYDSLNNIRRGSSYTYAIKHELISRLKNYHMYYEVLKIFFSDEKLKNILKKNTLDTSGKREDLIFRIQSQLSPKDIFGEKYILTLKGKDFIKKHEEFECFEPFSMFNFCEFVYFKQMYDGDKSNFAESFIDFLEETAVLYDDYSKYRKIVYYKLKNVKAQDSTEYLIFFTQLFIMDINNWLSNNIHENGEKPLSFFVTQSYPEIKELFKNQDIISIFNKANNFISIDYLKDKDDLVLFYLIKSLKYDDIEDINREIEEYTFEENYLKELLMK